MITFSKALSNFCVFSSAFAKRGLIAEYGSAWILPRLVGLAHANDILFSSRKFDAIEAERMGLVNRVIEDDLFDEEVLQYAKDLANLVSPRSLRIMKEQIYAAQTESIETSIATAVEEMRLSFDSDDFKEGVAHYMEKREPKFTGK